MRNKKIIVYVENLEGDSQGNWQGTLIKLGIPEQKLREILESKVGIPKEHSYIGIYDGVADFQLNDYENIYELNWLARMFQYMTQEQYEAFLGYCRAKDITDPVEMANVCMQVEKLSYERFPEWVQKLEISGEAKLGYTLGERNGMSEKLERIGAKGYFDYEAYGRDASIHEFEIEEHGYVSKRECVDTYFYSYQEIQKYVLHQEAKERQGKREKGHILSKTAGIDQILGVDEMRFEPERSMWGSEETLQETRLGQGIEEDLEIEITMEGE